LFCFLEYGHHAVYGGISPFEFPAVVLAEMSPHGRFHDAIHGAFGHQWFHAARDCRIRSHDGIDFVLIPNQIEMLSGRPPF